MGSIVALVARHGALNRGLLAPALLAGCGSHHVNQGGPYIQFQDAALMIPTEVGACQVGSDRWAKNAKRGKTLVLTAPGGNGDPGGPCLPGVATAHQQTSPPMPTQRSNIVLGSRLAYYLDAGHHPLGWPHGLL